MIVVSNTSPLNYLLLIDAIQVLPQLYHQVYVPPAVIVELRHPGTPAIVRQWTSELPAC